jgi:hypothetical protein
MDLTIDILHLRMCPDSVHSRNLNHERWPVVQAPRMIHLRGRPPQGWLAAPDTARDGGWGRAQFQPNHLPLMPCPPRRRPIRRTAIHKEHDLRCRYRREPSWLLVSWPPALPFTDFFVFRKRRTRRFWSSVITVSSSSEGTGVGSRVGGGCSDCACVFALAAARSAFACPAVSRALARFGLPWGPIIPGVSFSRVIPRGQNTPHHSQSCIRLSHLLTLADSLRLQFVSHPPSILPSSLVELAT